MGTVPDRLINHQPPGFNQAEGGNLEEGQENGQFFSFLFKKIVFVKYMKLAKSCLVLYLKCSCEKKIYVNCWVV